MGKTPAAVVSGLIVAAAFLGAEGNRPSLRLDGSVVPKQYRLDLTVVPNQSTFHGSVEIDIHSSRTSNIIWLNSTGLDIEEAVVSTSGGEEQTARTILHDNLFLGLETSRPIPAGSATIRIRYTGTFKRNGTDGLFTREDAGDWYAYTDFEPMDARSAFPCFDEPNFRATWQVTLHVPSGLKAFANAPVASEASDPDGLKTVRFKPTAPISTYLVAFAVGPFDVVDAGSAGRNRTPLRIIVPKGRAAGTTFARKVTPRILEELERYFGIPYPFEKLDQIAYPFVSMSGMENVGLITYGRTILSALPIETASADRARAALIAHEISHQWFGNRTTMKWWDDIWLNEAFAMWMQTRIVDKVFPEWNYKLQGQRIKAAAVSADSLTSARRVRNSIETRADIGQAFDGITYSKGAAVIAMFEHYVGEETFRKGVNTYLRKHAWKNTTTPDFLKELSAASGKDLASAFSSFLEREGIPLLRVNLNCGNELPQLDVRQERMLPLGSKGDRNQTWQIPMCFQYPDNSSVVTECTLLTDPRQTVVLRKAKACPAWVNADANAAGYYQVIYEGDLVGKEVATTGLTTTEQMSLLTNANTLLDAGLIGPDEALGTALRYASSDKSAVVTAVVGILRSAKDLVSDEQQRAFSRLIGRIFANRLKELGWNGPAEEEEERGLIRSILLRTILTYADDSELDHEARSLVLAWLKSGSRPPALTVDVIRAVGAKADAGVFGAFENAVENGPERPLYSFSEVQDRELLRRVLKWTLVTKRPAADRLSVLFNVASRQAAVPVLWEFVQQNYDALVNRLPELRSISAGTQVISSLGRLCTAQARTEVQSFFAERAVKLSGGQRALAQTLESIDLCVARRTAHEAAMTKFLRQELDHNPQASR